MFFCFCFFWLVSLLTQKNSFIPENSCLENFDLTVAYNNKYLILSQFPEQPSIIHDTAGWDQLGSTGLDCR
jgi:hypothetical protein